MHEIIKMILEVVAAFLEYFEFKGIKKPIQLFLVFLVFISLFIIFANLSKKWFSDSNAPLGLIFVFLALISIILLVFLFRKFYK